MRRSGTPIADGGRTALTNGVLHRQGNDYTLEWQDGMQLALFIDSRFISLSLSPSESRHGHLLGLLGNFDGAPANDLITRSGEKLAFPVPFERFYRSYVDSWRIAQGESLFDYGPGELTSTFTDDTFQSVARTRRGLVQTTHAAAVCRSANISADWLDACLLDVGMTGDPTFAAGFAKQLPIAITLEILPPSNATQ